MLAQERPVDGARVAHHLIAEKTSPGKKTYLQKTDGQQNIVQKQINKIRKKFLKQKQKRRKIKSSCMSLVRKIPNLNECKVEQIKPEPIQPSQKMR